MGCFVLCVESAARDVNELLTLHKIHPQVRLDVQRRLITLIERSYNDMTVLQSSYEESSVQICRSIATDIVQKVLEVSIPSAELLMREKECAALEQEVRDLKKNSAACEQRYKQMEGLLHNLRAAHEYMLHSYFREVYLLRTRIDDMQRAASNSAHDGWRAPSSPRRLLSGALPSPTSRRFGLPVKKGMGSFSSRPASNAATGRVGAASRPNTREAAGPVPIAADVFSMKGEAPCPTGTATHVSSDAKVAGTRLVEALLMMDEHKVSRKGSTLTEPFFSPHASPLAPPTPDVNAEMTPSDRVCDTPVVTATSPKRDCHSITPGPSASRSGSRGKYLADGTVTESDMPQRSMRATCASTEMDVGRMTKSPKSQTYKVLTVPELFNTASTEMMLEGIAGRTAFCSVDAIFDYEEYVRLLHGEKPSWKDCLNGVSGEADETRKRVRGERGTSYILRDASTVEHLQLINRLQGELKRDQGRLHASYWHLHLSVAPIKRQLGDDLQQIRREMIALQHDQHVFMEALSKEFSIIRDRSEGLLDFCLTYAQEIVHIMTAMKKNRTSKAPCSGVGAGVFSRPHVANFFTEAVAEEQRVKPLMRIAMTERSVEASQTKESPAPCATDMYYNSTEVKFWEGHPIIRHAQSVFVEFQILAERLKKRHDFYHTTNIETARGKGKVSVATEGGANTVGGATKGRVGRISRPLEGNGAHDDAHVTVGLPPSSHVGGEWRASVVDGSGGKTVAEVRKELATLRMRTVANAARLRWLGKQLSQMSDSDDSDPVASSKRRALMTLQKNITTQWTRDRQRIEEHLSSLQAHRDKFFLLGASSADGDDLRAANHDALQKLLQSPYLNDAPDRYSGLCSTRGTRDRDPLYVPIGTHEAGGGVDSYIVFDSECIPMRGFIADGKRFGAEVEEDELNAAGGSSCNASTTRRRGQFRTPYGAVMDYCRGVQMGTPLGDSQGPVYLQYDPEGDGYYVSDTEGVNLLLPYHEQEEQRLPFHSSGPRIRHPIPMTQIIFPAPRGMLKSMDNGSPVDTKDGSRFGMPSHGPYVVYDDTDSSSLEGTAAHGDRGNGGGGGHCESLPDNTAVYLVPLSVPEEGVPGRLHYGRSPASVLYDPIPVPLSQSYNRLLDTQRGRSHRAGRNPYLHETPRILRPGADGEDMLHIHSLYPAAPPPPLIGESETVRQTTLTNWMYDTGAQGRWRTRVGIEGNSNGTNLSDPQLCSPSSGEATSFRLLPHSGGDGAVESTHLSASPWGPTSGVYRNYQPYNETAGASGADSNLLISVPAEGVSPLGGSISRDDLLNCTAEPVLDKEKRSHIKNTRRTEGHLPVTSSASSRKLAHSRLPRLAPLAMPSPQETSKLQQKLRPSRMSHRVPGSEAGEIDFV